MPWHTLAVPSSPLSTPQPLHTLPWYPDTRATHHMTPNISHLGVASEYTGNDHIRIGNSQGLNISHIGTAIYTASSHSFYFKDVLLVPKITKSLLSIQKFYSDNACYFEFWPN